VRYPRFGTTRAINGASKTEALARGLWRLILWGGREGESRPCDFRHYAYPVPVQPHSRKEREVPCQVLPAKSGKYWCDTWSAISTGAGMCAIPESVPCSSSSLTTTPTFTALALGVFAPGRCAQRRARVHRCCHLGELIVAEPPQPEKASAVVDHDRACVVTTVKAAEGRASTGGVAAGLSARWSPRAHCNKKSTRADSYDP
jgi:hypothetical protein